MTAKPPPVVDLEIATATGRAGAAYVARLRADGSDGRSKMKTLEGMVEGTERDALAKGAEAALDALKWTSHVRVMLDTFERCEAIREALAMGDLERVASRHRIDVRHVPSARPHGQVGELVARARELAAGTGASE
jgi:hypothetical protein